MDMVYHGTYAAYLEAARVEMLRDAGWVYAQLEKEGILLPVVQLNLTYKKPARYDQELDVFTTVTAEPTTKLCLRCEVTHRDELLVMGEVVLVFVDAKIGTTMQAATRPWPRNCMNWAWSSPSVLCSMLRRTIQQHPGLVGPIESQGMVQCTALGKGPIASTVAFRCVPTTRWRA